MTWTVDSAAYVLGTTEVITVVAVSNGDLFGYARCRLSNGRTGVMRYPMVGDIYKIVRHPAKIWRHQDKDVFIVQRRGEAPVEMSRAQLLKAAGL